MSFLSNLISGISLGSVYAIIALGYTMVYGIAKMLNFAHGDVIMVGGYVCFCAMNYLNLPPVVGIVLAILFCTVLGIVIEKLAYKPLREASSLLTFAIPRLGDSYIWWAVQAVAVALGWLAVIVVVNWIFYRDKLQKLLSRVVNALRPCRI
jgi:branched-chain amino acid transport system permease protein